MAQLNKFNGVYNRYLHIIDEVCYRNRHLPCVRNYLDNCDASLTGSDHVAKGECGTCGLAQ